MDAGPPRNGRYIVVLATAACSILLIGWLARPREPERVAPPVASDTELQELARRAQRRALENTTAYFATLAGDVRSSLSYISPRGMTGIVWDDHRVVTGPVPGEPRPAVRTTAGEATMTRTIWSPRLPVTVLQANGGLRGPIIARRDAPLPDTGAWIAAVWLADQASAFAPASFLQAAQTNCGVAAAKEIVSTAALSPRMIGGGLFDLDGNLMALILPCDGRVAAIATASVEQMIALAGTVQERILARHGLLIGVLSEDERRYFNDVNGLLVREVWTPARGGHGILPGDIVTALNGEPVMSMDDLQPLTQTEGRFELGVRRGATTRTLTVGEGSSSGGAAKQSADIGIEFGSPARGFRVDSVQPAGRLTRAGIKAGDRLVRINGTEPTSLRQAERAIATNGGPMLIDVEREGRRLAIVVP